jgi:hypothetical protein
MYTQRILTTEYTEHAGHGVGCVVMVRVGNEISIASFNIHFELRLVHPEKGFSWDSECVPIHIEYEGS